MADCCTPKGYRQIFSERNAHAEAKRYRRNGLDRTSQHVVELLTQRGVTGKIVLEIGGGIGAIQIELLKAGAARAISVELTPTYEEAAAALLREVGLEDRVERRVVDFAEAGKDVEPADIVVMNRVICCYPDMPKLVGVAADHARGLLVMSFPKDQGWIRLGLAIANMALRLTRREFHIFVHSPAQIVRASELRGLKLTVDRPGLLWQVSALERTAP